MGEKSTKRLGGAAAAPNTSEHFVRGSQLARLYSGSLKERSFCGDRVVTCYGTFADGALMFVPKNRKSAALVIATLLVGIAPSLVHADILSSKRGFADTGANYNDLQASGASWYYTWGPGPANPGNFNANFYPMFWDAPSQATINQAKARNPLYVLGFNEPDNPTQSNMTVA